MSIKNVEIDKVGVHLTHCCEMHGCNYGDDESCPVENGSMIQTYLCSMCESPSEIKEQIERLQKELAFSEKIIANRK